MTNNKSKELVKNTFIISIGKFGTKLLTFFLLPLYTSILTTKEYGTYDLFLTISMFAVPLITLLMDESMFRFLIDCKTEDEKTEVISLSICFILISFILFSIIYFLIGIVFSIKYCFVFWLYILSSIISSIKNAIARGTGNIKMFSLTSFISSFLLIILNIIFIAFIRLGVYGLFISFIISNITVSIYALFKLKIETYLKFKKIKKDKLSSMIKYSIPLVPNSVSWTIINLSDRIVVSSVLGVDINGIYSVSNKFPSVIDTVYGFFYTAWKESAAKNLNDENHDEFYIDVYTVIKRFMFAVVLCLMAILPLVYGILVKKDFISSYYYVPILIIAIYFSNISGFFGGIFSAYKNTKIMGVSTIIGAIINLLINILLIKTIGVWAAAFSTLISTIIVFAYRRIKINKYLSFKDNNNELLMCIIILMITISGYFYKNMIINIIILVLDIVFSLLLNKIIVTKTIQFLVKKKSTKKQVNNI